MAVAGKFRDRAQFQHAQNASDGAGGQTVTWVDGIRVPSHLLTERGKEAISAGRLAEQAHAVLRVRFSSEAKQIDASDRVVIDGAIYQIRSVSQPDRRHRFIEMVIERGAGS